MVSVRIPATSANLGPGFDCLGLALSLYNYVSIENSNNFQIRLKGTYTSFIPKDESNLVWRSMCKLWNKIDFKIPTVALTLENHVPPSRGMGSSSAAIIGGLVAANSYAGDKLSKHEVLELANQIEGHPDNVTPALFGGVTLAVQTSTSVLVRSLLREPKFEVLAIVPDFLLQTEKSRSVLPAQISRQDAVFNISRAVLLAEALMHHDYEFLGEGMQDRLHQMQRANLIPGLRETLTSALENGAYGAALSGSGPTVLALVAHDKSQAVSASMINAFAERGLQSTAFHLSVDPNGAMLV